MQIERLRRSARSLFSDRFDVAALIEDDVAKPLTGVEASVCRARVAATPADANAARSPPPTAAIVVANT